MCKLIFFLENYYTNEIIDIFDNIDNAIIACKKIDDSQVTDENDNVYYTNIELPF